MNIFSFKTIGITGAFAGTLLAASPALAAERTVTLTGPDGKTATVTTDRTCNRRTCTIDWQVSGSDGNSAEGSHTVRNVTARHFARR